MGGSSSKNIPVTSASPTPYNPPSAPSPKKPITMDKLQVDKYYKLVTPIKFDKPDVSNEAEQIINNNLMSRYHRLFRKSVNTSGTLFPKVRTFILRWDEDPNDKVTRIYNDAHRAFLQTTTMLDSAYALSNYKDYKEGELAQPRNYNSILFVEGSGPEGGRRRTNKKKVKLTKRRNRTNKRI
jgi:hypothetical protein